MHFNADLLENSINLNQYYLNYSLNHLISNNKLLENQIYENQTDKIQVGDTQINENVQKTVQKSNQNNDQIYKQIHNQKFDNNKILIDYRSSLNKNRTQNRQLWKKANLKQSNKIYFNNNNLKNLKNLKNSKSLNETRREDNLSPHQVFTDLYKSNREKKEKKSNYIDDDRSSIIDNVEVKKQPKKRNTGSLTNLFYQYTALMQSQLLPALFMYNINNNTNFIVNKKTNSSLLPNISLSFDGSHLTNSLKTNNLFNNLSKYPSTNLSSSKTINSLFDSSSISPFSLSSFRRPEVAFLISSTNHSTYQPSFNTSYNLILDNFNQNDILSSAHQNEWALNFTQNYNDNDQNLNFYNSTNTSNFTLLPSFESLNLNLLLTILISVMMIACILVTAIGNSFVIAAILSDRILRSVQNYLVLSLALADLMVSLLVMPLAAVYEIQGNWKLGVILCDIWTWADVLCCTASILHLLAIAVDRYWAVTSVEYMRSRSSAKILSLIALVWSVALLVSVGPLLGWKDSNFEKRLNEEGVCSYSQDLSYQLFATVSTFYAPLIFILLLYWRIFQVARKRLRNKPGNQLHKNSRGISTKTAIQSDIQQNRSSLPNEDSTSSCSRTNSKYCKSFTNANDDYQTEQQQSTNKQTNNYQTNDCTYQDTNNNPLMQSTTDLSSSVNSPATTIIELHSSTNTPMHLIDNKSTDQHNSTNSKTLQSNGGIGQQINDNQTNNTQTELLPMKQLSTNQGKTLSVVVADNENKTTTTLILNEDSSNQFNVDERLVVTCNGDESDNENSRNSIKKNKSGKQTNQSNVSKEIAARLKQKQQQDSKRERKTARILAIITGVFVICWLPFFVLTLLKALIPKYRDYTLLFSIFLWLGYINSSLNPAIYTIFSPDFRSAFKKLIKGRRQN